MSRLTKSGAPRRKPGPKPRHLKRIQAAVETIANNGYPVALQACVDAYESAADPRAAAQAFKRAMPPLQAVPLSDWATIVASGMARGAFSGKEASTMLYAAQVAHSGQAK